MSDDRATAAATPSQSRSTGDGASAPAPHTCPLTPAQQTRNLLLFAACTGLQYLAAPVGYVGVTQASLCHELGASDKVANLPETAYLGLTIAPVILAWLVPYVGWLKRNLVCCYAAASCSQLVVVAAMLMPLAPNVRIAAVVLQAAVAGLAVPSAIAFLWELIGRGAELSRRGLALSLAFGVGPLLAVFGSLGSQLILKGSFGGPGDEALITIPALEFPANFALLYGCVAPAMGLAALLSTQFIVPQPALEAERQPFATAVLGGVAEFFRDPLLRTAALVTVLVYVGNTITSNLNLYSEQAIGEAPMLHAGNQNAVRFAFKMVAGLLLGWLLVKTNPKAGLLATSITFLASVVLALFVTGDAYLLVFGVYGAGELVGVYAPNYLLSASPPSQMRRNMALVTMMMAPAAPAGYLFGAISDAVGDAYGKAAGFRASFAVCAAIMLVGIGLAVVRLPARPVR